jgi:hypothetical protein
MLVQERYSQLNDLIQLKKKHEEFRANDPINKLICMAISIAAKQVNNYPHSENSLIKVQSKANIL